MQTIWYVFIFMSTYLVSESVDITDFSEFCNQLSQLLRKETAPHMSKRTEAQVLEDVTQEYLDSLDMSNLPSVYDMTSELISRTI